VSWGNISPMQFEDMVPREMWRDYWGPNFSAVTNAMRRPRKEKATLVVSAHHEIEPGELVHALSIAPFRRIGSQEGWGHLRSIYCNIFHFECAQSSIRQSQRRWLASIASPSGGPLCHLPALPEFLGLMIDIG